MTSSTLAFALTLLFGICGAAANVYFEQVSEFTSQSPQPNDEFGFAIAHNGPLWVVSAFQGRYAEVYLCGPSLGGNSSSPNSAFNCTFQTRLAPAASYSYGTQFGYSVAVGDGGVVAVGAVGYGVNNVYNPGAVCMFSCSLIAPVTCIAGSVLTSGIVMDQFGVSVAVSGSLVFVGASGVGLTAGSVYVFNCSTSALCFRSTNISSEASSGALYFGTSVAVHSSGLLAVGAPGFPTNGDKGQAFVCLCISQTSCCPQTQQLINPNGVAGDVFGQVAAFQADAGPSGTSNSESIVLLFVGAPRLNVVYVFVCSSSFTPPYCGIGVSLTANGGLYGDYFGTSIAPISLSFGSTGLSTTGILIGAPALGNPNRVAGYVQMFSCDSNATCMFVTNFTALDGQTGDGFGYALAATGPNDSWSGCVVGAFGKNVNAGAFYAFTLQNDDSEYVNIGAIVGGMLGGTALLLAIAVGLVRTSGKPFPFKFAH